MSSQWADYHNLFGSDDEEDVPPQSQTQTQPQTQAPAPAPSAPAPTSPQSEDDEGPLDKDDADYEEEEEQVSEEEEKPKKRVQQAGDEQKKARKPEGKSRSKAPSKVSSLDGEAGRGKERRRLRDGDHGFDDEEEDEEDHRGKKDKSKAAPRQKVDEHKDKSAVDIALEALKKKKSKKLGDEDIKKMCEEVVHTMETAAREDRVALADGRPATAKLKQLENVMSSLRNKQLQHHLTEHHGLLTQIASWLQPLPDKSLPLYPVRTPLITLLLDLHVEVNHLKESGIGRIIQTLSRHADETPENKMKLSEIIDSWSRMLTGKNSAKRNLMRPNDNEQNKQQQYMSQQGGRANDYFVARTSRGVEIPIRTGFNFAVMPNTKYAPDDDDDGGVGHEDEAMEVNEREPKDAESKASRVRKAMKDLSRGGSKKRLRHVSVTY